MNRIVIAEFIDERVLPALRAKHDVVYDAKLVDDPARLLKEAASADAVIVRNRTILSTGYNGSIRGMPHCSDVGHMMEDGHCVATIHAEANAIIQAAKNGVTIDGGDCYVTASPCWNCFKQLANAGITRICYGEFYRDARIFEIASQIGIELVHVPLPGVQLPALPPPPSA